jgi:hypothetical protein
MCETKPGTALVVNIDFAKFETNMEIEYFTIDVRTTKETDNAVSGYRTLKAPPFLLFFLLLSVTGLAGQDDTSEIKRRAEAINQALISGQYAKVVELTYPKAVRIFGGKEKMIAELKKGMARMNSGEVVLKSITIIPSIDTSTIDGTKFAIVPYLLKMDVPGGLLTRKSYLIGIYSALAGGTNSWTFIDVTDKADEKLKLLIPEAVGKLKIPAPEAPVFEKK